MLDDAASILDRKDPQAVIRRIAEALGCSVEVFSGPTSHELSQTLELLTAWLAIRNGASREQVLSLAKGLASRA